MCQDVVEKPFLFAVSGWKNAGKTTLIENLIPVLNKRGFKVATIKHDGHDFEPDVPGTDTWRHQKAGAYGSAVFSANRCLLSKQGEGISERELVLMFPEADIILLEGFKTSSYPKYIVTEEQRITDTKEIECIAEHIIEVMRRRRMGTVKAICMSEKKGTQKSEVEKAVLRVDHGLEGDAHAGKWHRQVSLLSYEKIEAFRAKGAEVDFGAFGENLVVEGYDFSRLKIGTRFQCGDIVLEMTQIGKECHHGCQIFQKMGDCIMPREGVFCKVLQGGEIHRGDAFEVIS